MSNQHFSESPPNDSSDDAWDSLIFDMAVLNHNWQGGQAEALSQAAIQPRLHTPGTSPPGGYTPVGWKDLPSEWPHPLGHSQPWVPGTLRLVNDGDPDRARLRLEHDPYQPCKFSQGPAAGDYYHDQLTRTEDGRWFCPRMESALGSQNKTWTPFEPGKPGVKCNYNLKVRITPRDADYIRDLEREHLSDYELAWGLSVELVARSVRDLPEAPLDEALGRLTDSLLDRGATYVLPATPDDLDAWGPRLKEVYASLAGQSSRRDDPPLKEHSPTGYAFLVDGVHDFTPPETVVKGDVYLTYELPPPNPDSDRYIKTSEIPPAFTDHSFADYLGRKYSQTGSHMRLDLSRLGPLGLLTPEAEIWTQPRQTGPSVTDESAVTEILEHLGGEVVSQQADKLWLKISLTEDAPPDGWDAHKELDVDVGYVLIRAAVMMLGAHP